MAANTAKPKSWHCNRSLQVKEIAMRLKKIFNLAVLAMLIVHGVIAQQSPVVAALDLKNLVGCWQGTLKYSGTIVRKPYSTTATLIVKQAAGSNQFDLLHIYTKEPGDQSRDTLIISPDGKKMNGAHVKSKRTIEEGVEIITQVAGFDNDHNKAALLKYIYILRDNSYSVKKQVQLEGQSVWQERQEFNYTRKPCEEN